ncbi:patatin-like phospholipase family protein [Candidatus Neomarinimicrobiota bacterium]
MNRTNRAYWLLVVLIGISLGSVWAEPNDRPKIGLVLSGGGARGFCHVGILEMIDSLQIPIDYIAGTSMGGITGALYAIGYRGKEIERTAGGRDWLELFSDSPSREKKPYIEKKDDGKYRLEFELENANLTAPTGLIHGQKIALLFSELTYAYEHIDDFDNLPIPFRCVAVDLITGEEIILKSGSLARAMRATMSIPSLFDPVEWGDYLLIDGGLLNNLPVDVAQEMGADIIIASNARGPMKKRSELNTVLETLEQTVTIPAYIREEESRKGIDILISPDLEGMNRADFSRDNIINVIRQGKKAAREMVPVLMALKDSLKAYDSDNEVSLPSRETRIHGIMIAGNTSLPFGFIYEMLVLQPNDIFDVDTLENRIRDMMLTGYYKHITYDIQSVKNQYIKLVLRVADKNKPIIHGVDITGNEKLSFSFIYNLLRIQPGDTFHINTIEERITELYSLGYFETISYDIKPVSESRIRLNIRVREHERNRVRLGMYYDNNTHLVGQVGIYTNNFLMPGMRLENTIRFSGMKLFAAKLYYPSLGLDRTVYPYLRVVYNDDPVNIYDEGNHIATYQNRYWLGGAGFGLLASKSWNTEMEYVIQNVNIRPKIGMGDLPHWDDHLRLLKVRTTIDRLDAVLIPHEGFLIQADYEESNSQWYSDIDYRRGELSVDYYWTFYPGNTLVFKAKYGEYVGKTYQYYKGFYLGGPDDFIGIDYDELGWKRVSFFRLDYRYQVRRNLYLKMIMNTSPNYHGTFYPLNVDSFWGYGLGIEFTSLFGPVEIIFSRGDKAVTDNSNAMESQFYLRIGNKF